MYRICAYIVSRCFLLYSLGLSLTVSMDFCRQSRPEEGAATASCPTVGTLAKDIARLMSEDAAASDLSLEATGGQGFPCHASILAARSKVFARMLDGERFKEGKERKVEVKFEPEVKDA